MPRPATKSKILPWFNEAAEKIVRENKKILQVIVEMDLPLTAKEAEDIFNSSTFQGVLRTSYNRFHKELAEDPDFNKQALIGQAIAATRYLMDEGKYDKALEGMFKIAKLNGWTEAENQINVFAGLSAKEIEAQKAKLLEKLQQGDVSLAN